MQIERTIKGVTALGPGSRMVVWVNGCHRGCEGCVSKRLQASAPQNEKDVTQYFNDFSLFGVDGITVSGGEPFNQIDGLYELVKYMVEKRVLDILIYTGYTIEELLAKNDERIDYILKNIAVLIDGPYVDALNDNKGNLKGSTNQRVIVLNEDYRQIYDEYYKSERGMQEFLFGNFLVAVGIPTKEYIESFTK